MCQHLEWGYGSDGSIKIEDRGLIDNKLAEIDMYIKKKKITETFLKTIQESENIGTKANMKANIKNEESLAYI